MPELLNPELPASLDPDEEENLRVLNRTPHPYHHQSFEIPYSSDVFGVRHGAEEQSESQDGAARPSPTGYPSFTKESSPTSDSGTEADDEHFLRGLPAPKVRLHKGLRGRNEPLSGTITPQLSPAILEEDGSLFPEIKGVPKETSTGHFVLEALRRKRIWVRRAAEVAILGVLGDMVRSNALVAPIFDARKKGRPLEKLLAESTTHKLQISNFLVSYMAAYWQFTPFESRYGHISVDDHRDEYQSTSL